MNTLRIFGEEYEVVMGGSGEDTIDIENGKVIIRSNGFPEDKLLKETLADYLHAELMNIYGEIRREQKINIFGNLRFEITEKIDGKRKRIAKINGNKIQVKLNAISLPQEALKYIIAHEIAHLVTKKHNDKFWKILGTIYPDYKEGEKIFMDQEKHLSDKLI